jgi:glycosyltransferase involved in cell wall biosynthesis
VALSVCIITFNEESNIVRTLDSVKTVADEIIIVDCGSADHTVALAQSSGAKVFREPWKGFAPQKNSALAKATGDWILSLDADEEVSAELAASIAAIKAATSSFEFDGYEVARRNLYLNRWLKRAGYYPDRKLRLVRRGMGQFTLRAVHEDMVTAGRVGRLSGDLIHHAYPTLESFIEHSNRYSSLAAEMVIAEGRPSFSLLNILIRPVVRFVYNYFFRFGFLDGREGLLVLLTHASYVSWKYAKAWDLTRQAAATESEPARGLPRVP